MSLDFLKKSGLKEKLEDLRACIDRDLDVTTSPNDAHYYLGKIDAIDEILELLK